MGKTQALNVVYDTGSDWLVVEGQNCNSCDGDVYNIRPALVSGQAEELTEDLSSRSYGTATVFGREYKDIVCIDLNKCVQDF